LELLRVYGGKGRGGVVMASDIDRMMMAQEVRGVVVVMVVMVVIIIVTTITITNATPTPPPPPTTPTTPTPTTTHHHHHPPPHRRCVTARCSSCGRFCAGSSATSSPRPSLYVLL